MYIKSAVLAAVASAVLASESSTSQNQINAHRQFKVEDKICVTKQPTTVCQHGFQPIYDQDSQRSVEMYCLDEAHPLANQMQQIMETGHRLRSMQQEAQKRTLQVPKVRRCKTTRLTKDGEVEDDADQQQQQQRNGLRNSNFNRSKFGGKYQQFQTKQERKQQYETIRAEQQDKLQELKKLMPTIEKAVQLSDSQYEEAYQLIKKIARQDEKIEGGLFMLSQYLPQAYVDATQRIQNELVEDDMNETEKQEVQEQLKKLAQRVYVYTLTRLVQEQQKQPISEQVEEDNYTNWEQFEEQFERLWHQIKREMDTEKIVKPVERQAEREFKEQIQQEEKKQLKTWQLTLQQQQDKQGKWFNQEDQDDEDKRNQQQRDEQKQPENWDEKMTREQRERQQLQLTKIIMSGLKTAEEMQKEQKKSGAFGGLFSSKVNYEQLTKQAKKQFQKTDF